MERVSARALFRKAPMDPLEKELQENRKNERAGLEPTGERYLPWAGDPVMTYEHLHRYAYASRYIEGKRVLDLASGEGYGSALLARTAFSVVGIDIDPKTLRHARRKYAGANIHFIVGSVTEIPLAARFDVVVCFELIEHIQDHGKLLSEIKRLLAPGGILVISTPNRPEYHLLEPSNPYHVKELDFEEFKALLARFFVHVRFLGQRVYCNSNLWASDPSSTGKSAELFINRNDDEFFVSEADRRSPLYFIGLASDTEVPPSPANDFLVDSSNSLLKERDRIQRELEATIRSQQEALAWREEQERQFQIIISAREEALQWRASQISAMQDKFRNQQLENDYQRKLIEELEKQMHLLQSGRAWKLLQKFFAFRDRILPPLSAGRRIYDRILGKIKL
jgi:O-antigen biosynthesis protein